LLAALAARNAARLKQWREAVEMALVGKWADALGQGGATDSELQTLLRRHTGVHHRDLLPLCERRVLGKRTVLHSQPIGVSTTIGDMLSEQHIPETETLVAELDDGRLAAVLRGLTPDEAQVAQAWAQGRASWARAALAHRKPAAYEDRVRRKLQARPSAPSAFGRQLGPPLPHCSALARSTQPC